MLTMLGLAQSLIAQSESQRGEWWQPNAAPRVGNLSKGL
jgi:hypothetical protein